MTDNLGVRLRPVDAGDIGTLFEQQRDTVANRMAAFGAPDPHDRGAFERRWQRILADPEAIARVIEVDGQVAGSLSTWRDPDMEGPEVTYWIGREFWGHGIATEALRQFIAAVPTRPLYGRVASTTRPRLAR